MSASPRRVHLDGSAFWSIGGRLIPVIEGAEEPLFPAVPEDLSTLSRADLEALASTIATRAAIAADPDAEGRAELVGDLGITEIVKLGTAAMDDHDRIVAHLKEIDDAAEAEADALAALSARTATAAADAGTDDGDDEGDEGDEGDGDDGDDGESAEGDAEAEGEGAPAEGEPVAVAAGATAAEIVDEFVRRAAAAKPARRRKVPARHAAQETRNGGPAQRLAITASGEEVTDRAALAQVFSERINGFVGQPASDGQKVTIARMTTEYPEDRHIGGGRDATEGTLARVFSRENLTGPQALTAAGGICAPPEPLYDVQTYAVDDRPVAAAIPSFQAARGGVTYRLPSTMGLMTGATGVMTADEDAEFDSGGEPVNTKDCLRIECPDLVTAEVEAIYKCVTIGNFGARTWPEDVAHNLDLASAEWARLAEIQFTNVIKSASTAVTVAKAANAWADLVGAILKARAGMISRHRMSAGQRFRVLLPAWLSEAMPLDGLRGGPASGHYDMTQAAIAGMLERYGVTVSFYKDGVTGGTAQVFGAQNAGALTDFPTVVQWAFFPEGSFFTLDNGTLDLGLVRDSTLNATNDYRIFMEAFLKVAYRGIESLWVTSTVCYSGQVQEAGAVMDCAAETSQAIALAS